MDETFFRLVCESMESADDQQIRTIYVTSRMEMVKRNLRAGPNDIWPANAAAGLTSDPVPDDEEPLLAGTYDTTRPKLAIHPWQGKEVVVTKGWNYQGQRGIVAGRLAGGVIAVDMRAPGMPWDGKRVNFTGRRLILANTV